MERVNKFRRHLATIRQMLADPDVAPDIREMLAMLLTDLEGRIKELEEDPVLALN